MPLISFSSATKFVSVRISQGKLDLFENYKGFNIFFRLIDLEAIVPSLPIASAGLLRGRGR